MTRAQRTTTTVVLATAGVAALVLGVLIWGHAGSIPEPGDVARSETATATPAPTTTTTSTATTPVVPATAAPAVPISVASTTTEPAAPAVEPVPAGSCGGWRDTIARYFPADQVATACRVAACESNFVPTAANPRSNARGLFQLMMSYHAPRFYARGWTYDDWADPEKNTAIAFELWSEQGWRPWACF